MKKIILLGSLTLASSCGLLFGGKTQNINLMPSDTSYSAEVEIISGEVKKTASLPSMVSMPRSNNNLVVNVKENECYKASTFIGESKINMFSFLNIFGHIFGFSSTTTDSSTGALWSYDNSIMINLSKKPSCKK